MKNALGVAQCHFKGHSGLITSIHGINLKIYPLELVYQQIYFGDNCYGSFSERTYLDQYPASNFYL